MSKNEYHEAVIEIVTQILTGNMGESIRMRMLDHLDITEEVAAEIVESINATEVRKEKREWGPGIDW